MWSGKYKAIRQEEIAMEVRYHVALPAKKVSTSLEECRVQEQFCQEAFRMASRRQPTLCGIAVLRAADDSLRIVFTLEGKFKRIFRDLEQLEARYPGGKLELLAV